MAVGFSQNFGINLRILSAALQAFSDREQVSRKELMCLLGVGDNKAEATVTWLGYLGLRDKLSYQVTDLSNVLLTFDPHFEDIGTQWIFHYKLASNPEAEVWYLLSNEFILRQIIFSFDNAINFLESKLLRPNSDQHLRADVSIFLKSFTSTDALAKTEYIKVEGNQNKLVSKNKYYVNPPIDISPFLIAYVIFNQKEIYYPNLTTITVEELLNLKGNAGRVFSLNRRKLEEIIKYLSSNQKQQLVTFSTTGGLDQVGFLFEGKSLEILDMYFREKSGE